MSKRRKTAAAPVISELPVALMFKPVSQEMPDTDTTVQIISPDYEGIVTGWWDSENNTWRHTSAMPCAVTHWCHIPEIPEVLS